MSLEVKVAWKLKWKGRICRAVASFFGLYSSSSRGPLAAPAALPVAGASPGIPCTGGEVPSSTGPLWQPTKQKTRRKALSISKVAQAGARKQGWGQGRGGCAAQGCGGLFSKANPSSPSALLLAGCYVGSSFLLLLKQQKA